MNDTTRQMGGALGVAILGSVFATFYRPGIADRLVGVALTSEQLTRARDSIGGALQVAGELPQSSAARVVSVAKSEFVNGMHHAVFVGLCVVIVAAVVVFAFLPAHAVDDKPAQPLPLSVEDFARGSTAVPLVETVNSGGVAS